MKKKILKKNMANDLPSGPETDIAIENGHLIRGFTH